MFKNLLSSLIKPSAVKVVANKSFLSTINEIKEQKQQLEKNNDNVPSQYNQLISQAIDLIALFCDKANRNDLNNAIDLLTQAQAIKRSKVDAYFYISLIAYMLDDINMAVEYLKIARNLDPKFPKMDYLSTIITEAISVKR